MRWSRWRRVSWIDTRASFIASLPARARLLDLGTSDGKTLRHFVELRPDLIVAASDIAGTPESYPPGTEFRSANFDVDELPWPANTLDAITCMHVVEHLRNPRRIFEEASRVLKPGGVIYVETPHPKSLNMSSPVGPGTEHVTVNFFDDSTHIRPIPVDELIDHLMRSSLRVIRKGTSRNLILTAAFPILRVLKPRSRARYVSQLHWTGWSAYIIAQKAAHGPREH